MRNKLCLCKVEQSEEVISQTFAMACDRAIEKTTFLTVLWYLLPALVLAILNLHSAWKNSKFTIQPPFMFLQDNDRNRLLTTVTYGFLSQNILEIIIHKDPSAKNTCSSIKGPESYLCSFSMQILMSTLVAFTSYPLFALISSKHLLVASILGIFYTVWEIVKTGLQFHFNCKSDLVQEDDQVVNSTAIIFTPAFVFLSFIYFGFASRLNACLKTRCYELPSVENSVVAKHQILHLQKLIKNRYPKPKQTIVQKLKTAFKPWYKFPSEIWQCMVVIGVLLYFFIAFGQVRMYHFLLKSTDDISLKALWYGTLILSIIAYIVMGVHFLYCVQGDSFSIYNGTQKLYKKTDKNYNAALYHHMVFPAYLISFMVVGFGFCYVFVAIVTITIYGLAHLEGSQVLMLFRICLSIFGAGFVFILTQRLIIRYALTDLEHSKTHINLKYPSLFFVLKFFLLFANILTSIKSLAKRLLLLVVSFLFFYGRIDRNPLVFFRSFDLSKTYASFLRVENVFKSPVMRCFCQMLLEPRTAHASNLTTQEQTRDCLGRPKIQVSDRLLQIIDPYQNNKRARNRWFLAYTLVNNPELQKLRKKNMAEIFPLQDFLEIQIDA
ncbi:stimulated by retinoic acid gene 6 protein-like [Clytia hemisphaerica]|uniref:stimulated by retinoic acid gene 6 protein-like n=1 Tax=Clytia hemisphaerica TaxID=252671 RepID=UPI0034D39820